MEAGGKVTATSAWRQRLVGIGAGVGLAVLYYVSRTDLHGYDAVAYAAVADVPAVGRMFHQNHPLFTPLVWLAVRAFRVCGYAGSAFVPGAAVSAALAAGAAAFFYLALRRLGAGAAPAAVATAAASFSAAWWFFAAEVEVVSCLSFFIAGGLYILASPSHRWGRAAAAAVWLGAATSFHITVLLFVPVAAILLAAPRQNRWLRLATFGAVYAVVAAAPYVIISQFVYGHRGVAGLWAWINFYEKTFDTWGVWEARRFTSGLVRVLCTTVSPGRDHCWDVAGMNFPLAATRLAPAVVYLGAAVATVGAAAPRLWREKRQWLVAGATWFVGYQLFFSWWDYGNPEWWVATVMPLWFLFGLAAPRCPAFVITAAAVVLAAASINFCRLISPASCPGRNPKERAARVVLQVTSPGDTLWVEDCDVAIWVKNLSRNTRQVVETGPGFDPPSYSDLAASLAAPPGEAAAEGNAIYVFDSELDNPRLGIDAEAEAARAALFPVVLSAEAVTVVPFPRRLSTLLRCRNCRRRFEDLRLYEAEREPGQEYVFLYDRTGSVKFQVVVPRAGRYVLCVQARGEPAAGTWPAMEISKAGRWLAILPADTNFWRFYEVTAELAAGPHEIDVRFCNPFRDPATGRDRLLFINRLAVYRAPPAKGQRQPGRSE
ncbi:MAG: hypothetical protein JSU81_10810 [Candidatus Coatesbacteria bacterium]|nr:MAG: hypothetical protein JSU81_10810 [Candidatus Coatesbacteria bacterium]